MDNEFGIVLARTPSGSIDASDFAFREIAVPTLSDGEVLVRPDYISIDPYLAIQVYGRPVRGIVLKPGEALRSRMVGTVVESRHAGLSTGDLVRGIGPWQSLSAMAGSDLEKVPRLVQDSCYHLSVLGASGITAWVGLHRVGRIEPGETMIVSGATGTIGSIAGQLARRHGCNVVAIAGGERKCAHARDVLGFDTCLDHHAPDFAERLMAVPAQIYFENVGGSLLDAALPALTDHARIVLCGMIAHYDSSKIHQFSHLHMLLEKAVDVRPYRVSEYAEYHAQALKDLAAGVADGTVTCSHTLARGLEAAPQAFAAMMQGKALGKSIIQVRQDGQP